MKSYFKSSHKILTLGIVSAFVLFSCKTKEKEDVSPQFTLDHIQGKWYRVYSNNPAADGMEVTVSGNQGTVTNPANSEFSMNSIKWKDIVAMQENKFEHQELAPDGIYSEATMELGQDDTLRIYVRESGAGNSQKWVRTLELDECTPYGPGTSSGLIEGTWSAPNTEDSYPGLLPAVSDPAGGYYIVTLKSTSSLPWLDIRSPGTEIPIINGTPPADQTERKVAISAQPGLSYDVKVKPFINGPNFPEDYTISWEYHGIMDCYEANDKFEQAKFIPKNKSIEAFANRNNEGSINIQEKFRDYYKIVLTEARKIQVTLEQSPSDNFVSINVYKENQSPVSGSITSVSGNASNNEAGSLYKVTTNQTLDPGIYYIEAYPYWSSNMTAVSLDNGNSLLDSWLTPYIFKVEAVQ